METIEVEGESIDAAIATALARLGVDRDRVTVEILNDAARGFLGLGARKARIRATVRRSVDTAAVTESVRDDLGDDSDASPSTTTGVPTGFGDAPAHTKAATSREDDLAVDIPTQRAIEPGMVERARDVLQTIVDHVGADARVQASEDGDHISLEIDGDSSGLLIGRKGQMLDALEYLVGRILARDEHRTIHVTVDSQGYRSRRQESLEELARRMAAEARRRKRAVTLNPMSPRDRRIVHLALQRESGLTTRSAGDGHLRKLVIIPDGAPRSSRESRR